MLDFYSLLTYIDTLRDGSGAGLALAGFKAGWSPEKGQKGQHPARDWCIYGPCAHLGRRSAPEIAGVARKRSVIARNRKNQHPKTRFATDKR